MSLGRCDKCSSQVVERQYKLRSGINEFRLFRVCKFSSSHSLTEEQLGHIDIDWHKERITELSGIGQC